MYKVIERTYIPIAAQFLESTVLIYKWSTVFLPLRCQVHHSLSTCLYKTLVVDPEEKHYVDFK